MKRDFLAALRAAVAQRAWVMVSILLSLVICASVVVLHLVHERSLDRATDIIRTVRQARLDLYAGFLHASLGGARDSPWQREQGHALLRQAYAQFEASMSGVDGRSAAARELAVRFAEFAALLPPVNQTQTGARQDVDLRVAFHRLDAAAGRLDAEARDALAHSRLEQTRMFWAVLMVAVAVLALLLARTLGLLRLTAEAQGGLRARDAALTESEQRFRQLAENINEVFWLTDTTKSEILYISSGYERIWGRTVATLFEQPRLWLDAIHPEDRQRVEEALPRQALGEYDIEYRILRPDGSLRWIRDRAFPVRDGNGHVYRVAGVAEDISEYRRALSDLTASEARLRVAVEASGIGIFERNMVTELRRYSPEFCAILGVDPVRGWTARKVLEPRVPQAEREALQAAIQAADDPHGTGDFQHEFPVVRADGETRWVVLRGRTHFDDDHGEMRRVRRVGTLVDVTARRQEEARRVLDEKTHALGTLAAGIAHDVNNILLAIDGYTRLAASQIPRTARRARAWRRSRMPADAPAPSCAGSSASVVRAR
jgi:PAS domain S-box-containing protein